MADAEVKVRLSAEDKLSPALKKTLESMQELHAGTINLAAGLDILHTAGEILGKGLEFLAENFGHAFNEAIEAEKATNRLTGALVQTGQFTGEVSKQLGEYAESLERLVGANAESVKGMLASGVQMGLNVEQSKKLEQASRQLAAANNIDVNEAFSVLKSTLAGNSRALGQYLPQVKELGSAQLKTGAAIDIVTKSTAAQYQIYQSSLPASLDKSKAAIDNVYKAFGNIITQSPITKQAINAFTDGMVALESAIKSASKFLDAHKETISAIADKIANYGAGLKAIAGDFDRYVTSQWGAGADKTKASIERLQDKVRDLKGELIDAEQKKLGHALDMNPGETVSKLQYLPKVIKENELQLEILKAQLHETMKGHQTYGAAGVDAQTALLEAASKTNAAALEQSRLFAGIKIGTVKQEGQDKSQIEQRDKELQDFKEFLEAKKRLATTAEQEQQLVVRDAQIATLGESEAGYLAKKDQEENRFQMDLDDRNAKFEILNMDTDLKQQMEADQLAAHQQRMLDLKDAHNNAVASRENLSDATLSATRAQYYRNQEKSQNESLKQLFSGTQAMTQVQSAATQTFAKLGEAMINNQEITAAKMVGLFLQTLGTQVQQKGFADMVMGIFPPNPVQIAAGAAEVAIGTGIGRLGVSMQGKNKGGQADEGMDSIPQSLGGKSFTLSAGERVVQPSANKELTSFLDREKSGGKGGGPTTVNITINGIPNKADAANAVDMMISELRKASERGVPIISERGVVKNGG